MEAKENATEIALGRALSETRLAVVQKPASAVVQVHKTRVSGSSARP